MGEELPELQAYEGKSVGSPMRLKADPKLTSDVCIPGRAIDDMHSIHSTFNGSTISLSDMNDVPSDDESGEVFDKMVASMLIGMNMEQYINDFKEADVGLNMFLYLTEDDLKVIGVEDERDRKDIAHGIANIRRRKTDDGDFVYRTVDGDVPDLVLSPQAVLPVVVHSARHITQLVLLLKNYRQRLDKKQMKNSLIDNKHCAALGLKILCKEAIIQTELLKVQLNAMLEKLEPRVPKSTSDKNKSQLRSTRNKDLSIFMQSLLIISSLTFATTVACLFRKR